MNTAENVHQKYTYSDYAQWPEDERWELIDGVAFTMASPLRIHQEIVAELGRQVGYGKPGVFGMDEPTAVEQFPDLGIDWSFMAET